MSSRGASEVRIRFIQDGGTGQIMLRDLDEGSWKVGKSVKQERSRLFCHSMHSKPFCIVCGRRWFGNWKYCIPSLGIFVLYLLSARVNMSCQCGLPASRNTLARWALFPVTTQELAGFDEANKITPTNTTIFSPSLPPTTMISFSA